MRIFGSDRISGLMQRLGMEEASPSSTHGHARHRAGAEAEVEAQNFSIRKHLLEYDDVMNKQREAFSSCASRSSRARGQREYLLEVATDLVEELLKVHAPRTRREHVGARFAVHRLPRSVWLDLTDRKAELRACPASQLKEALEDLVRKKYERKEAELEARSTRGGLHAQVGQDLMLYWPTRPGAGHLYMLDSPQRKGSGFAVTPRRSARSSTRRRA